MLFRFGGILVCLGFFLYIPALGLAGSQTQANDFQSGFDSSYALTKSTQAIKNYGFDDNLPGTDDTQGANHTSPEDFLPKWYELSGRLWQETWYNFAHDEPDPNSAIPTDQRGISRHKYRADLKVDFKLSSEWKARLGGKFAYDAVYAKRSQYTAEVLDEYESDVEFAEVWLSGPIAKNLDLKTGRQIITWGESDHMQTTDVLNPYDNREFGLIAIEDLRLPVFMTRLNTYWDNYTVSGIVIHEARFWDTPEYGSDFFPRPIACPPEEEFNMSAENQQYALSVTGNYLNGIDLTAHYANIFYYRPFNKGDPMMDMSTWIQDHSRINMYGLAGHKVQGNWLIKAEAAYLQGVEIFWNPGETIDRVELMAGVNYTGITNVLFTLDAGFKRWQDWHSEYANAPDGLVKNYTNIVFFYTQDLLNDTLHLNIKINMFGAKGDDGMYEKFWAKYDWTDNFFTSAGVVFYESGDWFFLENVDDNDRFFLNLQYRF